MVDTSINRRSSSGATCPMRNFDGVNIVMQKKNGRSDLLGSRRFRDGDGGGGGGGDDDDKGNVHRHKTAISRQL